MTVFVEGGGDHNKALQTECRRGFSQFFRKAGLEGRMPRVVACGGREQAYKDFRTAHEKGDGNPAVLLVDSEGPVNQESPWEHVRLRAGDGWDRPQGASEDQLHLMVQAMEAWFHGDREELRRFYGQSFRENALSSRPDIESTPKADLISGLRNATKDCPKGEYSKGGHSFKLLERIDPTKVRAGSAWAERLLSALVRMCG
ncbi:MAG: DUF4276 family protein [Bryobacterales bacterium]|nr:DUF4276 family protein [Bryobacterales bacterium]